MGTQIQSETYFLRHSSRSLSESISTGRWLSYQEGKIPVHSQHEDSSSPWRGLTDRYSGQDKARVKETILEHEVTFRNQVRELHRLYRRQRELMNAIQDNGLYKIQKKTESSQSLVFPSYLSSENGKRTLDRSHFLSSDSVLGRLDPLSSLSHQPHTTALKRKNCESFHPCSDMYLHKPVDLDISRGAHMNNEETVVRGRSFGMVGNVVFSERRTKEFSQESNVQPKGRNYLGHLNEPSQFLSTPSSGKSSCHLSCHADKLERQDITANISSGFSLHKESSQYSMPVMNGKNFLNRSPMGCHGNGKELKSYDFKFSNDLSLHVEHKTERRTKRKIFGVEIAEEVDESSLVSSNANNSYARSNGAESETSPFLSGKAFTSHLSTKVGSPQGGHGAATSEPSWLKLGSCLQNLELVTGTAAPDALKSSVPKSGMFQQSPLLVHPQPDLIDGAAAGLDILKGNNDFTSLPDLFEFHDPSNCWKSVNSKELKARNFLKDSEIIKEAKDRKDGHTIGKIVGFPSTKMINKTEAMCLPTDAVSKKCPIQLVANPNAPEKILSNCISGLRNHIDLNMSIDEEEAPAPALPPLSIVKIIRPEIDLEAPPLIESEIEHRGTKSLDKSGEPREYLIEEAAEALLAISSSPTNNVASYASCRRENTSDCLHWFTDVIFSYTSDEDGVIREISQGIDGYCDEEAVPHGIDYFEFMTLQLKDVKEETYSYNVSDIEHQKSEETEISPTKRRSGRGHERRGRQKKNFQKDVLPDLVSLAKQEVVEDLQTLEELFHSTGKTWKSSLSQKKGAKNGRRGMKARESLHTPEAYSAPPPSKQKQTGRELHLRGKSFTGWGKRTRRLPRQRCSKKLCSSIQLLTSA